MPGYNLPPPDDAWAARSKIKSVTPEMILNDCSYLRAYADKIADTIKNTQVSGPVGLKSHLQIALDDMHQAFLQCHQNGFKVMLVGNGGSSAICSHVAIDLCKNAGIRAISLNDFPSLTCLSNDYGYDQVFAKQIEYHAKPEDVLVCISTGGKSANIINAIKAFNDIGGTKTYTFTGMLPDNTLRTLGATNFYTPSRDYGIVEIAHLTLLHSLCPCEV